MLFAVKVVALVLVTVAMSMATAHALEFPGKLHLDRQSYGTVQTIYYPGFIVGRIGEALAVIATLTLMLMTHNRRAFWWMAIAFLAVVAMHAISWLIVLPTYRCWLRNQQLGRAGARVFFVTRINRLDFDEENGESDWQRLRNRWEYSHVVRAILSGIALIALAGC